MDIPDKCKGKSAKKVFPPSAIKGNGNSTIKKDYIDRTYQTINMVKEGIVFDTKYQGRFNLHIATYIQYRLLNNHSNVLRRKQQ